MALSPKASRQVAQEEEYPGLHAAAEQAALTCSTSGEDSQAIRSRIQAFEEFGKMILDKTREMIGPTEYDR